jgi:hypothetical protein
MLGGGELNIDSIPETQKIYYTATAKVTPKSGTVGTVLVNKYNTETGEGIIVCNSDIIKLKDNAFSSNKFLNSIIIPNGVTEIENSVFNFCVNLKEIYIPSGIITIGNSAFGSTKNIKFNITDLNAWCQINRSYGNGYENTLFLNGVEVVELLIPNDITEIFNYSFNSFNSIVSVTIPDNIESIGIGAFSSCKNLKEVFIGDGVTKIDFDAFYFSDKLKNIKVGKNVQYISENAFSTNCQRSCFDFSSHDSIPVINDGVFNDPEYFSYSIIVPDSLYNEWIVARIWSKYASRIIKKSDWDTQQVA